MVDRQVNQKVRDRCRSKNLRTKFRTIPSLLHMHLKNPFQRLGKYVHYYYFFDANIQESVDFEKSYTTTNPGQFFRLFLRYNWLGILFALVAIFLSIGGTIAFDFGYKHTGDATLGGVLTWCEGPRTDGRVFQLQCTYSALAFVIIGCCILFIHPSHSRQYTLPYFNLVRHNRIFSVVFGVLINWVGFGSIFYHGDMTYWGRICDSTSLILIFDFIILWVAYRIILAAYFEVNSTCFT